MKKTEQDVYQIYDRMFKRILTLSSRAVISLINALFQTSYPPDSRILYNWTEHVDGKFRQTLADVILTVNGEHSYHIEAQMYPDEEIELRVFDYGYHHALKHRRHQYVLNFPEPQVIYLYESGSTPDIMTLVLDFGTQGIFEYKVPVFKLMEHELDELDHRKMIILIPFMLLKLRKKIEKERSPENIEALRHLIFDDIMNLIVRNRAIGNITAEDAVQLVSLIRRLYNHLYAHYDELAEGGFNDMIQDDFVLDSDIFIREVKERVNREVREEVRAEVRAEIEEIKRKLREEAREEARKEAKEEIEEVRVKAREEARKELREELKKELERKLRHEIEKELREELKKEAEQFK